MGTVTLDFRIPFDAIGLRLDDLEAAAEDLLVREVAKMSDLSGVKVAVEAVEDTGATGISLTSGHLVISLAADPETGEEPDVVRRRFLQPILGDLRFLVGGDPAHVVFGEGTVRKWTTRG